MGIEATEGERVAIWDGGGGCVNKLLLLAYRLLPLPFRNVGLQLNFPDDQTAAGGGDEGKRGKANEWGTHGDECSIAAGGEAKRSSEISFSLSSFLPTFP